MNVATIFKIQLAIIVLVGTGWFMDIVKLTKCDFDPIGKAEIIYAVGLIPPIGMVTGWMNFGK